MRFFPPLARNCGHFSFRIMSRLLEQQGRAKSPADLTCAAIRAVYTLAFSVILGTAVVIVLAALHYKSVSDSEQTRDAVIVSLNTTMQGIQQVVANLGQRATILEHQLADHQAADQQGEMSSYLQRLHDTNIAARLQELERRIPADDYSRGQALLEAGNAR